MDWLTCRKLALEYIKKYRYFLLVFLVGIILMLLPTREKAVQEAVSVPDANETALQEALTRILEQVSGAGRVSVLLTQAVGEETVYQTNEDTQTAQDTDQLRRETVLLSGAGREEAGLVRQVKAPVYRGAVIVCQGADSASVRLAIVEAVRSVTGLSSNHISVLKMK